MIICAKCFASERISETIKIASRQYHQTHDDASIVTDCPTCGNKSDSIFDTDCINEYAPDLVDWFSDLITSFDTQEQLPADYPKRNLRMLSTELKSNWNIFACSVSESMIYDIVTAICSDLYKLRCELFDKPVALSGEFDPDYWEKHSLTRGRPWKDFVEEITYHNRYHARTINLDVFERIITYLRTTIKEGSVFYRCRLTDSDTAYSAEEMGPPPPGVASPGRANAAGISCLYLASDIRTAIAEVRAGVFDNASIAQFQLKEDIPVIDFRGIQTLCPVGIGMNYHDFAINKEHLKKVDSEMGRGLKRGDHSIDYVATQYITDFVKSIRVRDENGDLQNAYLGIVYNSTLNPEGYNLAIFKKEAFECISTKLYQITSLNYLTTPRMD